MKAAKTAKARPAQRPSQRGAHELPHEVRIIGGAWKRSKLPVADRPGLRPTPDRVRETLFNWLGQTSTGWRCVDAFAGTGALGFEAASRGAAEVVLLERDPVLVASLRRQQGAARRRRPCASSAADALQWLARAPAGCLRVVFLDPPFDSPLLGPALARRRAGRRRRRLRLRRGAGAGRGAGRGGRARALARIARRRRPFPAAAQGRFRLSAAATLRRIDG